MQKRAKDERILEHKTLFKLAFPSPKLTFVHLNIKSPFFMCHGDWTVSYHDFRSESLIINSETNLRFFVVKGIY